MLRYYFILFTRLLAHTPPEDVKYLTAASRNYTGVRSKYGNLSRSLSFLTFWVSLIPKIKSGALCQA